MGMSVIFAHSILNNCSSRGIMYTDTLQITAELILFEIQLNSNCELNCVLEPNWCKNLINLSYVFVF